MKRLKHLVVIGVLSLLAATLLTGCGTIVLFDPKGPIGDAQATVIIIEIGLMALVVIPVYFMDFWFARKYRASNTQSTYMPKWHYDKKIDLTMWAVPIAIVIGLGTLAWLTTHSLNPYRPIPSAVKPLPIQVVGLDWKWLFIYPEQNIAAVNEIVFPVKTPVSFKLTSDTVMTSFFIPQLGSQIYAMAGMRSKLHLMADEAGTYTGHNQQLSGAGYANMYFDAKAVSSEQFQAWVKKVQQAPEKLDVERYEKLALPTVSHHPVTYFSSVQPQLFLHILRKYDPYWGQSRPGFLSHGPASQGAGTNRSGENRHD